MPAKLTAPTAVSVPSADLINYRFDQSDKKFDEVNTKLDTILTQNEHFVTEEQVSKMVAEALKPTTDQLANWRWYWRAVFSGLIVMLGTVVAYLVFYRPR